MILALCSININEFFNSYSLPLDFPFKFYQETETEESSKQELQIQEIL